MRRSSPSRTRPILESVVRLTTSTPTTCTANGRQLDLLEYQLLRIFEESLRRVALGPDDNFFDCGGTSLTAVKLAIATGRVVSLKDITRQPVLADLAAQIDRPSAA